MLLLDWPDKMALSVTQEAERKDRRPLQEADDVMI